MSTRTIRQCGHCDEDFEPSPSQLCTPGFGKFCSRRCSGAAIRARARDPERVSARFWSKVDKSGGANACWPWTASLRSDGYGQMHVPGKNGGARASHRWAWELTNGPPGRDVFVCHHCDNPKCCNPEHLYLGDDKSNSADKVARGRHVRGERVHSAKLSDADCARIRELLAAGQSQSAIAREFAVTQGTISRVATGARRSPPTCSGAQG